MYFFLGYSTGMKAYKLYEIQNKQIFISHDVVFHEEIFPFSLTKMIGDLIYPFPALVLPSTNLEIPDVTTLIPPNSLDSLSPEPQPVPSSELIPLRRSS